MSSVFRLEFALAGMPDRELLTRLWYCLVAHGHRFNTEQFDGTYRVIPGSPSREIVVVESDLVDRTERLADAVDAYERFDPDTTELAVTTTYVETTPLLPCFVHVLPRNQGHLLSIGTNETDIRDGTHRRTFLDLGRAVVRRFDIVYGASRLGEEPPVPTTADAALEDHPRQVTFYPSALVERVGRERLLGAPAETVEEFPNGSVYLLASIDGDPTAVRAVGDHLS